MIEFYLCATKYICDSTVDFATKNLTLIGSGVYQFYLCAAEYIGECISIVIVLLS